MNKTTPKQLREAQIAEGGGCKWEKGFCRVHPFSANGRLIPIELNVDLDVPLTQEELEGVYCDRLVVKDEVKYVDESYLEWDMIPYTSEEPVEEIEIMFVWPDRCQLVYISSAPAIRRVSNGAVYIREALYC